jgi:predicted amidohydrolase
MTGVRIACCQVAPRVGDRGANLTTSETAIRSAAATGARIVVLPELMSSGYVFRDKAEALALAERLDGPSVSHWHQLAGRHDVTVVAGVCEQGEDDHCHNTAVVVDPGGLRASYRKVHLWDAEKLVFTAGDRPPPVVEVEGARVSVMICYDLEFPEWVRLPALAGAQLLCAPANWPLFPRPAAERPMEVVRVQAAASANRMFIAVCDRVGQERGVDWVGGSVVVDPDGWPLAGPRPGSPAMLVADCEPDVAKDKAISERNDVHADRRPELYAAVLDQ